MILSRKTNFATHRRPNPARLAESMSTGESDRLWAAATRPVDSARPIPVNTQNGTISRVKEMGPSLPHTHRLLSKKAGMAVIITDNTFDNTGSKPKNWL